MRHSRVHFHNRVANIHLPILETARFWDWDIGQWFTPPKSKSPWEAATSGSTGGNLAWAGPSNPKNPNDPRGNDWVGKALTAAAGMIPVYGPFISTAMGAAGSMGGGTGYQGSDYGNRNWGSTALGGLGGYAMGGIGSGIGGAVGGAAKSGLSGIGSGFMQGVGNYGAATAAPFNAMGSAMSGGSTAAASGANNAAYLNAAGYNPATYGMGGTAASSMYGAGAAGGATGAGIGGSLANMGSGASYANILGQFNPYGAAGGAAKAAGGIDWGQVAGGLGVSMIPNMMGGEKTQIPQSQLYGEATSRLLGGQGMSDIGKLGREKLTENLSGEFSPVSDEYYSASTRRLDEAYDKAEKDFTTQFQSIRPGADVSGDSAYREGINKLRQDRAREKSGLAAELDYRRESDYMDRQYQNIQSALNIDQQTMQDYLSLAQMDANQLALNTGITLGEAAQFKEIFGNLGSMLMQRGVGLNDPTKALQSIMSRMG